MSLLPGSGKLFQRLLYDIIVRFFTHNSLILHNNQAINQMTRALTHQIHKSLDEVREVRSLFSHICDVLSDLVPIVQF